MLIRRLQAYQAPTKPLRFRVNASLKPVIALKIYLALLVAQGLFEYFFMWTLGLSFLGLQTRLLLLGVVLLVSFTCLHFIITRKRYITAKKENDILILFLIYIGLIISVIISIYFGIGNENNGAWDYSRSMIILLIVALFSYLVTDNNQSANSAIKPFILACTMMAVLGVVSQFISWRIVNWPFLFSNFRWVFAFASSYFLARYFMMDSEIWRNLLIFIIVSASLTLDLDKPLIVSYVVAMIFVTIASWFVIMRINSNKRKQFLIRIFILIVFIIAAIAMLEIIVPGNVLREYWMIIMRRFLKRNPVSGASIGTVDGGRFYIYQKAYEMLQSKPIWGYGLGVEIRTNSGIGVPPHNIIADFILGTGIFGFIMFSLICIIVAYMILRKLNYRSYGELKLGLLGYIVFVSFFSLVGVLWTHVIMVHMFAITLGVSLKLAVLDGRTSATSGLIKVDHVLKNPGA